MDRTLGMRSSDASGSGHGTAAAGTRRPSSVSPRSPRGTTLTTTAGDRTRPCRQPVATTADLDIVVPARDEAARLPRTLDRTLEYLQDQPYRSRVLVVDNGSVDRTADVARGFADGPVPVEVLSCARPGKGVAVRTGFAATTARYVGFMDADLATPVETLDLVVPLLEGGSTVVIGSRRAEGARLVVPQSVTRRLGGSLFRAASQHVLPGVTDSQCGFKFFRGDVVRLVAARCRVEGFGFDVELLGRLREAGHDAVEVPVTWTDVPGSTFSPLRHGLRSFTEAIGVRRPLGAEVGLTHAGTSRTAVGPALPVL